MSIHFDYDISYPGPAFPIVQIAVSSETDKQISNITALVDTGADATIIPRNILNSIDARRIDTRFARNVDGSRYPVKLYSVKITIGPYTVFNIDAIANEHTVETILGRDVLNQLIVNLNGIEKIISVES